MLPGTTIVYPLLVADDGVIGGVEPIQDWLVNKHGAVIIQLISIRIGSLGIGYSLWWYADEGNSS